MARAVIIPARYESQRLPGKVLRPLGDCTMLERTFRQAKAAQFERVIIATDHQKVFDEATSFCPEVYLTTPDHQSGTDRIAEVIHQAQIEKETIVVNLQADVPFMPYSNIRQVADNLAQDPALDIATLCVEIQDLGLIKDPNAVKVVRDINNLALYFSRAPIPWDRDLFPEQRSVLNQWFLHLGLYAYRAGFITTYTQLAPSPLEKIERLEQLRALYYGHRIHVDVAKQLAPHGIDTEADLLRAQNLLD